MGRIRKSATTPEPAAAAAAGSDVLDLILGLQRTPALRFQLRDQPLPADLDVILRLAAQSQPLLEDAAARCGTGTASLLEAARFYVLQVLLEPGTDAYRVLGATAATPQARLREHHQWLQRWLHPDRVSDETGAAFAARVNWAWQQLRNERQRARYDAATGAPAPATPDQARELVPAPAAPLRWTTVPVAHSAQPGRWWRRAALAGLFGSCAVLFVLAMNREGTPIAGAPEPSAPTLAAAPMAARPEQVAQAHAPAQTPRSAHAMPKPRPAAMPPAVARHAITAAGRGTEKSAGATHRFTSPEIAGTGAAPEQSASASVPTRAHGQLAPARLPVPPVLRAAIIVDQPSAKVALAPPQPAAAPIPVPTTIAVATPPPTSAPDAAAPPQAATPAPAVLLHRVELAREQVRTLVAYLRGNDRDGPAGTAAPAPYSAAGQRAALRARRGLPLADSFALDDPAWRLGGDSIAMDADYRVQRDQTVVERGRFSVRMVWHGHAWQVTHLQLEPQG